MITGGGKRIKKAKGKTKTDIMTFIKFIFSLQIIHGYYLGVYLMEENAVTITGALGRELNVTAFTE